MIDNEPKEFSKSELNSIVRDIVNSSNKRDWSRATTESHRSSGDKERNDWTFKKLSEIKK